MYRHSRQPFQRPSGPLASSSLGPVPTSSSSRPLPGNPSSLSEDRRDDGRTRRRREDEVDLLEGGEEKRRRLSPRKDEGDKAQGVGRALSGREEPSLFKEIVRLDRMSRREGQRQEVHFDHGRGRDISKVQPDIPSALAYLASLLAYLTSFLPYLPQILSHVARLLPFLPETLPYELDLLPSLRYLPLTGISRRFSLLTLLFSRFTNFFAQVSRLFSYFSDFLPSFSSALRRISLLVGLGGCHGSDYEHLLLWRSSSWPSAHFWLGLAERPAHCGESHYDYPGRLDNF
ncbi:hypothetical protein JCM8547_002415 [Rhodosporidiobolus lusitaniae]